MNNILNLIKFINEWQNEYDSEFKPIPIDNHSCLIFNYKNKNFKFIFSNEQLRNKCKDSIPLILLSDFLQIIEQEDGITFYS